MEEYGQENMGEEAQQQYYQDDNQMQQGKSFPPFNTYMHSSITRYFL